MPGFDVTIGDYTLVPNPFWGGVLFPMLVFGFLLLWPTIERRRTGDRDFHNLLDHPRDRPWRTAVGAAVFSFVAIVFLAGAMDRVAVSVGVPYTWQIWIFRAGLVVVPVLAFVVTRRVCSELRERSWTEVGPSVAGD
jgi:ubiquinol-cytochrome c reductase cytochrome b subunit